VSNTALSSLCRLRQRASRLYLTEGGAVVTQRAVVHAVNQFAIAQQRAPASCSTCASLSHISDNCQQQHNNNNNNNNNNNKNNKNKNNNNNNNNLINNNINKQQQQHNNSNKNNGRRTFLPLVKTSANFPPKRILVRTPGPDPSPGSSKQAS
jgi:hypothetical protein